MPERLAREIKKLVVKVPFLPAVTFIVPFNPKMIPANYLRVQINDYYKKAARLIREQFDDDLGILVIQKLHVLLKGLRYDTLHESVAVFISPVYQQVLYLNFAVEPYVNIGDSFSVREVLLHKDMDKRFLVLALLPDGAKLYEVSQNCLHLIKSNGPSDIKNGYAQLDKELKWILDACHLPVVAVGGAEQLRVYRDITINRLQIFKFIPADASIVNDVLKLTELLICYTQSSPDLFTMFFSNELRYYKKLGKVEYAVDDIMNAIHNQKGKALFVKRSLIDNYDERSDSFDPDNPEKYFSKYSFIKNSLDDIICQAIENDVAVEVVDVDFLEGYRTMALVKK